MLSHSLPTNQSSTAHRVWSPVPSGRHCLGTEFSVPEGRGGGWASILFLQLAFPQICWLCGTGSVIFQCLDPFHKGETWS